MVDYTIDPRFAELRRTTEAIIEESAAESNEDAISLLERAAGVNNLQGHMAIVPLTVWLVRQRPDLLRIIRDETNLNVEMARHSQETSGEFWENVKDALMDLLEQHGDDRIIVGERINSPETPIHIANTYLSHDYGGGQVGGGGGTIVLKRTLKLLVPCQPEPDG